MAQVVGASYPGAPQQQPQPGGYQRVQPVQPDSSRPRQQPAAAAQQPQQQQQHRHSSQHARPPGASSSRHAAAAGSSRRGQPPAAGQAQQASARPPALPPSVAADNMADLEQLRRQTPFLCSIRFRNNLPEIPSDPKLITSTYEPERLSKFFLTSVEQQPRRELLLPADAGVPISVLDLERYDVPDDLGPRPKLDPADEVLLQDVEGLPSGAGAGSSSVLDVKRSKKADIAWLMSTTYLTSAGEQRQRRGAAGAAAAAGSSRFQMGSSQQQQPLTREQQLADIEATFDAARKPPRHPTKPGVTAVRSVPILPDFENWPNKYVVVHFPEGDPANDSRTLAKVPAEDKRRDLLAHSLLKSYQTQAAGDSLTVGLLVPKDLASKVVAGEELPEQQSAEEMAGDYSWDSEYNFDLLQNDPDQPQQQLLLLMHEDRLGYCNLDGSLKLRKRKRQAGDARPSKAIVLNRDYLETELDERAGRREQLEGLVEGEEEGAGGYDAADEDVFGPDDDVEQEEVDVFGDAEADEEAEQGGLGYQ